MRMWILLAFAVSFVKGYEWIQTTSYTFLPEFPVRAGTNNDGQPIYIAKAYYKKMWMPASYIPAKQQAYVSLEGSQDECRGVFFDCPIYILSSKSYQWVKSKGNVPPIAMSTDQDKYGIRMYIGRRQLEDTTLVGKIMFNVFYAPYKGKEFSFSDFDFLLAA